MYPLLTPKKHEDSYFGPFASEPGLQPTRPGKWSRAGVVIRPTMPQLSFHTPLGALTLSEDNGAIVALDWGWGRDQTKTALLCDGRDQLQAYFDARRQTFTLPLAPHGTPYQRRVWQGLQTIPYGQTCRYGALAADIGGSARSIGCANSRNPIPILIPCHRVVGYGGLGGYSSGEGLETKRWLLALEQSPASEDT